MDELRCGNTEAATPGRAEAGFTVIEVMVASLVLVVGMLGVLTMLTGALRTTNTSNTRVAATNLARELVETTRGLDYDNLTDVVAQLQSRGLGSGSTWTIDRRGVQYTVSATTCAFDDPSDGYATAAAVPANACPNSNAVGTDPNGEDFRRVTFRLDWNDRAKARSLTQATLIVDPTGGRPRILAITPLTQTITGNVSTASVVWTTTPAQTLRWDADDGVNGGDVTGSTSFTTAWNIGTAGPLLSQPSAGEVLDGSYTITAVPSREGLTGEGRRADVVLNRRLPYAPRDFAGGHDTRVTGNTWVDFEWSLNRERDILGYRVLWAGPDGIVANGNDDQVCPAPAAGTMLPRTAKSCADFSSTPHTGAQTYYIVAIDRDASGAPRDGETTSLAVSVEAARPSKPTGSLAATTVSGATKLTWNAVAGAAFYRIYRDGTAYGDRYDRTTGATTTYTDTNPGATSHTYYVTTIDNKFNESDPLGPKSWP